MSTDHQNKFYTSISKYYAEIFPYKPSQLNFVKNRVGDLNGKKMLDIGCATGELAFQLANSEVEVMGIDLNKDLLEQARLKNSHQNIQFKSGNMLDLENDFYPAQFDAVLCFGNTLVHLHANKRIEQMLKGVYQVLKAGGHFLLQILNYDYVLNQQISELPVIETKNIKFVRKYGFEKNSSLVHFQTDLILKKENEIISNKTPLLALKSEELHELLSQTNFADIELFSDFKMESFGGEHLPLVVSCRK
ncbi:methyltransferase domain-containing protein [Maribellus comscasis]|uniref:Methyltransferase domain-containing protein n=1 Tax=Maribellus comscasis TaxID=2681766 RepID=A0A6I6K216_9BACT|nr:class I SAM-dependent methyltransferase [Maribellus comscasis]QGY47450.1 methyltransferase domain-containing protein [Maribellus comscasis]